jgi:hypothetical protein
MPEKRAVRSSKESFQPSFLVTSSKKHIISWQKDHKVHAIYFKIKILKSVLFITKMQI